MTDRNDDYELLIRPTRGWFQLDVAAVWRYRDLLLLLVHREFVSKYKQTILGPAWFILQPLLMTAVFAVVFGAVAQIPTDGVPPILFYLTGLLGWTYFATTFQTTSATLITNAGLFGKVYFPRLVVPLSAVISNLLAFAIQFATWIMVWCYYRYFTAEGQGIGPSGMAVLWFPLLVLQIAALSFGVGLWISALTAKYRDFAFLVPFLVQIWMYATPVIYPFSRIPERYHWIALLNPMTMPTEAIKLMLLGRGVVTLESVLVSLGLTLVLLLTGTLLFNRVEKNFVDTI